MTNTVACILTAIIIAAQLGADPDMLQAALAEKAAAEKAQVVESAYEDVMARFSDEERFALAKCLWGEARGVPSQTRQAAVIWCVLNRVDSADPYYPDDIIGVVTQPYQFAGYSAKHPVSDELLWLVDDVLYRWATGGDGRVLPQEYIFFAAKNGENVFRTEFTGGTRWDWSLPSPYET